MVQQIAKEILFRVEQVLRDDPAAVLAKQSAMLPRELEDSQVYFLQKIEHVRQTVGELQDLLQLAPVSLDIRERVATELMLFFVLIESYRPERMVESGWRPNDEIERILREKIESLSLDIINVRERLK
jgi:hypothetical protein